MNNNLDFLYVTSGLEVSFRVISKVPAKSLAKVETAGSSPVYRSNQQKEMHKTV